MAKPQTLGAPLREGADYPSPITQILALGYYDGPTQGVLQCGDGGPVYKFDLIDGPFCMKEGWWDLRVYRLAPLPATSLAELAQAYSRYWPPRWPIWLPIWHFQNPADEEAMNRLTDHVLNQAGAPNWVVASFDLTDTIRAAKAVTAAQFALATDWLKLLGIEKPIEAQRIELEGHPGE